MSLSGQRVHITHNHLHLQVTHSAGNSKMSVFRYNFGQKMIC